MLCTQQSDKSNTKTIASIILNAADFVRSLKYREDVSSSKVLFSLQVKSPCAAVEWVRASWPNISTTCSVGLRTNQRERRAPHHWCVDLIQDFVCFCLKDRGYAWSEQNGEGRYHFMHYRLWTQLATPAPSRSTTNTRGSKEWKLGRNALRVCRLWKGRDFRLSIWHLVMVKWHRHFIYDTAKIQYSIDFR